MFKTNGFDTKQNFQFKAKRKYEIDIIAIKNSQIICVDCKWWGKGRYKKSGLKKAASEQEKRVLELDKFLKDNSIAKGLLRLDKKYSLHSLVVTLHEEEIAVDNATFIVPAWKLNQFLLESERYF